MGYADEYRRREEHERKMEPYRAAQRAREQDPRYQQAQREYRERSARRQTVVLVAAVAAFLILALFFPFVLR